MLLAFLLSPVVAALERRVGRAIAVALVVVLAFSLLGGVGWVLSRQVTSLADELPKYRANVMRRVAAVRGAANGGSIEKLQSTAQDVMKEVSRRLDVRENVRSRDDGRRVYFAA